jgi:hypothetical protein
VANAPAIALASSDVVIGKPPVATATKNLHNAKPVKTASKGAPPATGGFHVLTTCTSGPCFNYAQGYQNFTSNYPTTVQANTLIANPYLDTTKDAHSLMEIAITHHEPSGLMSTIELIVTKDPLVCGQSTSPCLTVFSWINGVPQGYGTGFVNYTGSGASVHHPGDSMSTYVGAAHVLGWQLDTPSNTVWAYEDGGWIGEYPLSNWTTGGYSMSTWDQVQTFGEVASKQTVGDDHPCSDMGTGDLATTSVGAYFSAIAYNAAAGTGNMTWNVVPSGINGAYNIAPISARTARLGGTGWTNTDGIPGNKGSC